MSRILISGLILIGTLLGIRALSSSSIRWNMNAFMPNSEYPQPRSTGFSTQVANTSTTNPGGGGGGTSQDFNTRPISDSTGMPPGSTGTNSSSRQPVKGGW